MLKGVDHFYLKQEEPTKSCLLALKEIILALDPNVTNSLKYGMPFFSYKNKMFCYLWTDKNTQAPYIGIVEGNRIDHPNLEQGNRKRMKILRVNRNKDLPIDSIQFILNQALDLYRKGIIKTKR